MNYKYETYFAVSDEDYIDATLDGYINIEYKTKKSLLEKLKEGGNTSDILKLDYAKYLLFGVDCRKNEKKALSIIKSVDENNPFALCLLGAYYEELNPELSFDYYQKSADLGFTLASYVLNNFYKLGNAVVSQDLEKAFELCLTAAEAGNALAQFDTGINYCQGCGVEVNNEEAIKWFKKAGEQENSESQFFVYLSCFSQGSKEVDREEAFSWLKRSSDNGFYPAYYFCGCCYIHGDGTKKNTRKGFGLVKKAAINGVAEAMDQLGECYLNGIGTKKDEYLAVEWFKNGAEAEVPDAIINLAICYEKGIGVEKSEEEAERLFRKAYEINPEDPRLEGKFVQ